MHPPPPPPIHSVLKNKSWSTSRSLGFNSFALKHQKAGKAVIWVALHERTHPSRHLNPSGHQCEHVQTGTWCGGEGFSPSPALPHIPYRLTWAAPGAGGGRWLQTSSFASLFPFVPTGRLGSYPAFANSPRMAAIQTLQYGHPAEIVPSATSAKRFQFECSC